MLLIYRPHTLLTTRVTSIVCGTGMQSLSRGEPIIHSVSESLFASEVLFRPLHGHMAQQKLDLLQLTSRIVAESSA
jgi:hypothetical protein